MAERVRWVTKAEAARELDVSISTLDRKSRMGEVEVRREGRRVYVRMVGEYVPDEERLRRAVVRETELERSVGELERKLSQAERRASGLERELDEAKKAQSDGRLAHYRLEREHEKEVAEHKATNQVFNVARVVIPRTARGGRPAHVATGLIGEAATFQLPKIVVDAAPSHRPTPRSSFPIG